jgi:choloylglycine hydrolase
MCTAVTYSTKDHYFGRNLDFDFSYQESVTVTPRNFPFSFRHMPEISSHYAMIGMAFVVADYPLYYDAINEKGLSMAGLLFPDNAVYHPFAQGKDNICPFEFIPWLLSQCATVTEARALLERINLVNEPFSDQLPLSPLHWLIADQRESITVECMQDGLHIHHNPVGVLTNSPSFDYQLFNLQNYMGLSPDVPENRFSDQLDLKTYSRGMGGLGLPGDLSSVSRFVKAAFTKMNALSGDSESESVSQFYHILDSVDQQRGCCHMGGGKYEITIYGSCCNMDKGIYYYKTYENSQITGVDMHHEDLDSQKLVSYPMVTGQHFRMEN